VWYSRPGSTVTYLRSLNWRLRIWPGTCLITK
jgi:hypothetical protein